MAAYCCQMFRTLVPTTMRRVAQISGLVWSAVLLPPSQMAPYPSSFSSTAASSTPPRRAGSSERSSTLQAPYRPTRCLRGTVP